MPDIFSLDSQKGEEVVIKKDPIKTTDPLPQSAHQPHENVSLLSTFARFPDDIRFQNQETNEDVHLFLRRHIITNVPWVLTTCALVLLPLLGIFLMPFVEALPFTFSSQYFLIFILFYYLIVFGYAFVNFTTWFHHVGIVTNLRVLDIDVTHISSKNVAATNIADIVDVEYSQSGFLSNFFDYGNVNLQTEGLKPNFEFNHIPRPAKAADVISDLIAGRPSDA